MKFYLTIHCSSPTSPASLVSSPPPSPPPEPSTPLTVVSTPFSLMAPQAHWLPSASPVPPATRRRSDTPHSDSSTDGALIVPTWPSGEKETGQVAAKVRHSISMCWWRGWGQWQWRGGIFVCVYLFSVVLLMSGSTLLKMGRYYNTTLCHYWEMSVK